MKNFILHIVISFLLTWLALYLVELPGTGLMYLAIFLAAITFSWPLMALFSKSYFYKVPVFMGLILYFLKELFDANLKIAYDVLTPTLHMQPAVFALELDAKTDLEITLLSNLVTLTPGTLCLDVSEDRKLMYIHAIYFSETSIDDLKAHIKNGFEKKILKLTR